MPEEEEMKGGACGLQDAAMQQTSIENIPPSLTFPSVIPPGKDDKSSDLLNLLITNGHLRLCSKIDNQTSKQ